MTVIEWYLMGVVCGFFCASAAVAYSQGSCDATDAMAVSCAAIGWPIAAALLSLICLAKLSTYVFSSMFDLMGRRK